MIRELFDQLKSSELVKYYNEEYVKQVIERFVNPKSWNFVDEIEFIL
jgi:hypothetical protein